MFPRDPAAARPGAAASWQTLPIDEGKLMAPPLDDFDLDVRLTPVAAANLPQAGPTDTIDSHAYSCGRQCTSQSDYCPPVH